MPGLRADQVALYTKDMYKAQREGYKEVPTKYNVIFKVKNKDVSGAGDKETQILGAGGLVRHLVEGQDVVFKAPIQGWEYLVKYWTFSDGLSLSKEAVEDTVKLGNLLRDLANTWGKSVRVTKETFAARFFNEGGKTSGDYVYNGTHTGNTDSSGDMLYDGKPMFAISANEHTTKGTGTYVNSVAAYSSVTPTNFELLYNLHTATNNRDERDRIVSNPADTFLVSPGADRFLAERIVDTSRGIPGVQLNDMNPYYKLVSVVDWDYLSDSALYVGKRQSEALQFHERQLPEIRFFRDEANLGYKASLNLRIGGLVKGWRPWTRGGGSSTA